MSIYYNTVLCNLCYAGYVVENSDIIFIAVKPHLLDPALEDIKKTLTKNISNKLFVSILAGTTIEILEEVSCLFH